MEKIIKPMSGYLAFVLSILVFFLGIYIIVLATETPGLAWLATILFILFIFIAKGIMIINPNHSRVLTFFGEYVGSVKVNPLFRSQNISLRANNLNGQTLKVNDKMGNPIEIAAVIVWQVKDTYKAAFEVEGFHQYVQIQSEAAVRHLAVSCPYEHMEGAPDQLTLRDGGEKVNDMLEKELNERLSPAGIHVLEARISHLAYSPEIAGAMLQRQQATAIVAARSKIVEGAVGMVEMALEMLSQKQIVTLDEERKATMVSNLLVVLCGEKGAQPVLNTGSLYQ
jgi:regulator of protease activity HflC (stomatin/prohibitin superfamily)